MLDKAENFEDTENAHVDFDTYYKEASQPHMHDANSFISLDTIPQITNKKELLIPAKLDIEKIKEMLKTRNIEKV